MPVSRARVSRGHPEDDLQMAVVNLHRTYVAPADALLMAVPNGEKREKATAARLSGISNERRAQLSDEDAIKPYGLGVIPGVNDLILLLPAGRTVWVELKIPLTTWPPMHVPFEGKREVIHAAGSLSREQKRWRAGIQALAHEHRVVRSTAEYVAVLDAFGVPFRRGRPWGPGLGPPT